MGGNGKICKFSDLKTRRRDYPDSTAGNVCGIKKFAKEHNTEKARCFMAKKNKIRKLTDDQYYAYIMGLKDNVALFDSNGDVIVPDVFENKENKGDEPSSQKE